MRALVQKVSQASLTIDGVETASIGKGYVVFLGIGARDERGEAEKIWKKISKLRIFEDSEGKTNLDLQTVGGSLLIVSQFTLLADCKKGNRPSFIEAARPEVSEPLYDYFISLAKKDYKDVQTGEFGADMKVALVNDGPFTIWLDTEDL